MKNESNMITNENSALKTDYDIPKMSYLNSIVFIVVSFLSITFLKDSLSSRSAFLFIVPVIIGVTAIVLEALFIKNNNKKKILVRGLLYSVISFLFLLFYLF